MVLGGAGDDSCAGDDGDDELDGGAGFDDVLGGHGNDVLVGGLGGDYLNGSYDDDVLYGDFTALTNLAGTRDELRGGSGFDQFVYFAGNDDGRDVILDFNPEEDVLRLVDVVDSDDDRVWTSVSGDGDLVVNFAGGGNVELDGIANIGNSTLKQLVGYIPVEFGEA